MKYATLLFAALCIFAALPAATAISTGPSLNASLLYYEPVPATPGSVIDVYVQITNKGNTASSVDVHFADNGPFTLVNTGDRVKSTPTIPSGESFLVKYTVRVNENAPAGESNIKIEYGISGSQNLQTDLLPITISSRTVSLSISGTQLQPAVFIPGNIGRMIVTLHNDADQTVSSGSIKLDLDKVDLTPIQSTNQQRFTNLAPGGDQQFIFELTPSPSMAPGVYKIPVNISFSDQQGKAYQMSEVIGVRVGAIPDISVVVDDVKLTDDGNEVTIRVTNKGLGEIKFVNLVLGDSESYKLTSGSKERYVGNIDSDDYKTSRVTVDAKEDEVTMPVTITYMDALNQQYTKEETLHFTARKAQRGSGTVITVIAVLLVLGIIAYLVLRKRK